jgi:hydrogenase-4 component E
MAGSYPLLTSLNGLACGLFLIASFGLAATRQMQGCQRFYITQSVCLVVSALLLGIGLRAPDLVAVAALDSIMKPIVIPLLLRRTVPEAIFKRREIDQVLNIPSSLLIALALTLLGFFLSGYLPPAAGELARINLPIGLAGLFIGVYTLTVRREAVPQLIGIFGIENGALLCGFAIAPTLPLVIEIAFPFDMLIIALVIGILTRITQERIGTTEVGGFTSLKEGAGK